MPSHSARHRRSVAALVLLASFVVGMVVGAGPAPAETASIPVTVSTTSRNGLVDGSSVGIHVDATGSAIYGVEARLCDVDAVIDYSADFNPSQAGKCINAPLSASSDAHTEVALDPAHYGSADLTFRVGVGTNSYTTQFDDEVTIQCGPGHPCKLTVKLQVPNSTVFKSFPLSYAGDTPLPDLFHPLSPTRILDSRPAPSTVGPYTTKWGAGTTRTVSVAGVGGVPADADAVVLNATATATSGGSYLTIWPTGQVKPTASSINWASGATIANSVTVKVGSGGTVSVFNVAGSAHVIFDVVGYFSADDGAGFTGVAPTRILDSRPAPSTVGPYTTKWGAGTTRTVSVAGVGGVPADADAVVLNATATATSGGSYLTIWPTGQVKPTASSINWASGATIANSVTVKVGSGGTVSVFNAAGSAHVIFDVVGYFKVGSGDAFHPLSPIRIQDSRPAPSTVGPYTTKWAAGQARPVQVASVGGVPANASSVLLNVTATGTTAGSYLTIWPAGTTRPTASSVNWANGQTIANAVTAKPNGSGTVGVFNAAGAVHVIADVAGWYGP